MMDLINPGNFGSFDPGATTGLTVFGSSGIFRHTGDLKFKDTSQYKGQIMIAKESYNLKFAIIENFVNQVGTHRANASKVVFYLELIKECFDQFILVNNSMWQLRRLSGKYGRVQTVQAETDKLKRVRANNIVLEKGWITELADIIKANENKYFSNSHTTDSFLMGYRIFEKADAHSGGNGWNALHEYSKLKKLWPDAKTVNKNGWPWAWMKGK